MTLRALITERQALRYERRADEIASVQEVGTDYRRVDRAGDLEMEAWFASAYQAMPTDELRDLIARGFVKWQRSERNEDAAVDGGVGAATDTLKQNNAFWLGE